MTAVSIVIPMKNESGNVEAVLGEIAQACDGLTEYEIIVVDDGSTDDEVDYCEEWGWYGDGICDEDCAQPDPDCDEDGSDEDDVDHCEEWGWYGDGICDEDCAQPDPDCD